MVRRDDDPIFCRRCTRGEAWPSEQICTVCQDELEANSGWLLSWQEAWKREKDEKRRKKLSPDSTHASHEPK